MDKSETRGATKKSIEDFISKRNFLFIRLLVIDLNDNQPKFSEAEYKFVLNETTEMKAHYSMGQYFDEKDPLVYYYNLLNATCNKLKETIRVKAVDSDEGLNSVVKYKISQQKHLKNPNAKMANLQITKEDRYNTGAEIYSDSIFYIDEATGEIYLVICKMLNDENRQKVGKIVNCDKILN